MEPAVEGDLLAVVLRDVGDVDGGKHGVGPYPAAQRRKSAGFSATIQPPL